jgi:hypothetical protein
LDILEGDTVMHYQTKVVRVRAWQVGDGEQPEWAEQTAAEPGQWIVRKPNGELIVMTAAEFAEVYEPAKMPLGFSL